MALGDTLFGDGQGSPETIRQRIVDAVKVRLAFIRIVNGYGTNIGANIFEQKAEPFETSEIPGMTFVESIAVKMETVGAELHTQSFEGFAIEDGDASPAMLRKIWGDLITAIGIDRTWDGLAQDTTTPIVSMAETKVGDQVVNGVRFSFDVTYTTRLMNPYS